MRLKRLLAFIVLVAFSQSLALFPSDGADYTLKDLWKLALENNESIRIASYGNDVADAGVRQAWGELLPKVDLLFLGNYYDQSQVIDFGDTEFEIFPRMSYTFTATLIQPVFTGFRVINGIKMANRARDISKNGENLTHEMIFFAIAGLYYQVKTYEKEIEVLEQSIELAKKEVEKAKLRFDVGEVTRPAVLVAELTLKDTELQLTMKRNSFQIAKVQLAGIVGLDRDYNLSDPVELVEPAGTVESLTMRALEQRKELRISLLNKDIAGYQKSIAVGGLFPTISIQAQYLNQSAIFPAQSYASIGVVVSYPIFDGGKNYAAIGEANAKERIADLEIRTMKKKIFIGVKRAYSTLQAIKSTVKTLEVQQDLARENYELNSSLYEVGDATALELSTALNGYEQAKIAYLNMKYQKDVAILNLKNAMGELLNDY